MYDFRHRSQAEGNQPSRAVSKHHISMRTDVKWPMSWTPVGPSPGGGVPDGTGDGGDGRLMDDALAMGVPGFVVAALVPGIIRATRSHPVWHHVSLPAGVALPLFLVTHTAATLGAAFHGVATAAVHWFWEAALIGSGFLFWLPVLGGRHRLSEPGRCLYLFLTIPLLDLPAAR